MKNLEDYNEEFNNFMYRVTEVSEIISKLNSDDKDQQKIATLEADRYLKGNAGSLGEDVDENVKLKVKYDKSVINHKAFSKFDQDPSNMTQETFMEHVEKDAEERYKNTLMRKEKAETFKVQALKAFRRGEYEKALNCYNKAIEQVKDSTSLYLNRAVTLLNLKLSDRAIEDIKSAQRFNENSLKSWLLLSKIHHLNENAEEFDKAIKEAKERNEDKLGFIGEYIETLNSQGNEKS